MTAKQGDKTKKTRVWKEVVKDFFILFWATVTDPILWIAALIISQVNR